MPSFPAVGRYAFLARKVLTNRKHKAVAKTDSRGGGPYVRTADCRLRRREEPHHHYVVPLPFTGEAYLSNFLRSKSLPLTSLPSVALLVTRILTVWIMMTKSSKML